VNRAKLQPAPVFGMFEHVRPVPALAYKPQTIIHLEGFARGFFRQHLIIVAKVERHDVEAFQRVASFSTGRSLIRFWNMPSAVPLLARARHLESCQRLRMINKADCAPERRVRVNPMVLAVTCRSTRTTSQRRPLKGERCKRLRTCSVTVRMFCMTSSGRRNTCVLRRCRIKCFSAAPSRSPGKCHGHCHFHIHGCP